MGQFFRSDKRKKEELRKRKKEEKRIKRLNRKENAELPNDISSGNSNEAN